MVTYGELVEQVSSMMKLIEADSQDSQEVVLMKARLHKALAFLYLDMVLYESQERG